jgi:hypothetical protein
MLKTAERVGFEHQEAHFPLTFATKVGDFPESSKL